MGRRNLIARLTHVGGSDVAVDEFANVVLDLVSDAVLTRAVHHTEVRLPLGRISAAVGRDIVEAAIQAAELIVDEIAWREEPADALA